MLYEVNAVLDHFWKITIKNIITRYREAAEQHRPTTARFIFLAPYNFDLSPDQNIASPPASFGADFGALWLSFTKEELTHVLTRAGESMYPQTIHFEVPVVEFILSVTGGHVGINILGLELLQQVIEESRRSGKGEFTSDDIVEIYISAQFRRTVRHSRLGLDYGIILNPKQSLIIRYLLCQAKQQCSWNQFMEKFRNEDGTPSQDLTGLVHRSLLQKLDKQQSYGDARYGFPCPLMASILCEEVFQGDRGQAPPEFDSIHDFILYILPNFSHKTLLDTLSKGAGGRAYERAMQMEFYRCAIPPLAALGFGGLCYPDVGYKFHSGGFVDFYISGGAQWAVELLRNSQRLQQHADRKRTIYSTIPVRAYAVLNFVDLDSGSPSKYLSKEPDPPLFNDEIRILWTPKSEHSYFVALWAGQTPGEAKSKRFDFKTVANGVMMEVYNNMLEALRKED